ncbi:hypothetical protein APHAL10511_006100 [Amanita phalloides]|nr:hypothetical protein APHAL10511_006100 [Amanita phalloides]
MDGIVAEETAEGRVATEEGRHVVPTPDMRPLPSTSRGLPVLQPDFFSSDAFVRPFRADFAALLGAFAHTFAPHLQHPFTLFKNIWLSLRWHYLLFKVFDDRSRHTFLTIALRLFLEKTIDSESPLTRTTALFAFYTFFYAQPIGTAPPLYSISHVPIALDHYLSLTQLPDLLTTPDLLPLRPYAATILHTLCKDDVFYILPRAALYVDNPRELPREEVVGEASCVPSKRKRGRPSKQDKARQIKGTVDKLTKQLDAGPSQMTLSEYVTQKTRVVEELLSTEQGRRALGRASERVVERLQEAGEQAGAEAGRGGLERAQQAMCKRQGLLGW